MTTVSPSSELQAFITNHLGYIGALPGKWTAPNGMNGRQAFVYNCDGADIFALEDESIGKLVVVWPHGFGVGTPTIYGFNPHKGQTDDFTPVESTPRDRSNSQHYKFTFVWHSVDGRTAPDPTVQHLQFPWRLNIYGTLPHFGRPELIIPESQRPKSCQLI